MVEYLDVLDESGEKTGESLPHSEIHRLGKIHRTVHICFINSKGELLLQKRTMNKWAYPGYWDITIGGHISTDETDIDACIKETKEEIGLDVPGSEFKFIGEVRGPRVIHGKDFIDDEFKNVYVVNMDIEPENLSLPEDEVEEVRWVTLNEFKEWMNGKGEKLIPDSGEFKLLIDYLDARLNDSFGQVRI
jgi:isopentenyl-diphosphate Delta-isomerase